MVPDRRIVVRFALAAAVLVVRADDGARAQSRPPSSAAAPADPGAPAGQSGTPEVVPPAKPEPSAAERQQAELSAAWAAASRVSTEGPAKVGLRDQADLDLPKGHAFIPRDEATRILRAYGNVVGDDLVGLIAGTGKGDRWLVVIRFIADGYIKDDDAKDWDADALLKNLEDGNAAANADRRRREFPEIEIVGWIEKPAYDAAHHRLVWSLSSKGADEPGDADHGVNYNTYALGRDGYFSLNLLTTVRQVAAQKPIAQTLLSDLAYRPGKRYADFDSGTDRIAAYGLAALVGGVAVKKLGLLAVIGAFALKFAKVGILAAAGLGAAFAKLFRRRPKAAQGGVSQGGTTSEAPSASGPSHAASAPRDDV